MSKTTNDGGPAFPHTRVYSDTPNDLMHQHLPMSGMSLRAYFAGQAMQGLMVGFYDHPSHIPICARLSVECADFLISELNKTES